MVRGYKRVLGLSGGSTKGAGILGAAQGLNNRGFEFDAIIGTSVGAILSVPVAMWEYREATYAFLNITEDMIFGSSPVSPKGKVTLKSICYLIRNKLALGDMSALRRTIASIITEKTFNEYKNGNYPDTYSISVDVKSGMKVMTAHKDCAYQQYLDLVIASASIPVYTMPVITGGSMLFDGGLRDHAPTHELISEDTELAVTIFSRQNPPVISQYMPKDALGVLEKTIEIMNMEISKNDEHLIDMKCEAVNARNVKLFLPKIMKSLYDTDSGRLSELYRVGYDIGVKQSL